MLLTCPDTGDRQVLLGESIGIGLAIGLVCGVIFVSIFFIVYRSSYIQNLAAMKKDTKFTGCKNRKVVTSHTSSEPQEAQPYQTRTEIIDDKKRQHENIAVRYKNQQQEEEINVSETDYQNTDHYPHGYDNNYDQPTYENVADMSNYEYEYDYIAPSTVQRWYDEAQSSEGYVHMQSPRQT
ncbi:hypothetical protein E2C01_078516 [Portunus trituberculatus]|uniref:Uncharacterized protein n=1 Tax=Portunus trituberculatus TaxID=210409 RepID=A0A5B7IP17_PORTR|nr:hypothetical protein [Portunus trituberculatus]